MSLISNLFSSVDLTLRPLYNTRSSTYVSRLETNVRPASKIGWLADRRIQSMEGEAIHEFSGAFSLSCQWLSDGVHVRI